MCYSGMILVASFRFYFFYFFIIIQNSLLPSPINSFSHMSSFLYILIFSLIFFLSSFIIIVLYTQSSLHPHISHDVIYLPIFILLFCMHLSVHPQLLSPLFYFSSQSFFPSTILYTFTYLPLSFLFLSLPT